MIVGINSEDCGSLFTVKIRHTSSTGKWKDWSWTIQADTREHPLHKTPRHGWQTCGTWQTNPQKVICLAYYKRDKQQYIHYLPYLLHISHVNPDPSLKNKPKRRSPAGGLGPEGLGLGSPPLWGGLWSADPPSLWKASESVLPITEIVPFKRQICPSAKKYKRGKKC